MTNAFSRTEMLIGAEGLRKLHSARVAVFGLGGVGSYAAEALARSGVGRFLLVDNDLVSQSNINRQIHATYKTIGMRKTILMQERILEINPLAQIDARHEFYSAENGDSLLSGEIDYIVDAIDSISAKIDLICRAKMLQIPIISSMGAGNKVDATRFRVEDIYKTRVDPIARVLRRELKRRGIAALKVVYSEEKPLKPNPTYDLKPEGDASGRLPNRAPAGSIAWVPSVAGLILAGEVVMDLTRG